MSDPYRDFLAAKAPVDAPSGLSTVPLLPLALKPFQQALTEWALRRGRAALFEGTGLGKTVQQLSWARAVVDQEQGSVLVLTPLAVAEQTVAEAEKFGIGGVAYAAGRAQVGPITITNYERFDRFDTGSFAGVVLDESGIIKSHDGKLRAELTDAWKTTPFRLCCTATPAPNDYGELGQHSEFLGVMSAKEMLSMFFVHDGSIRANDDSQGADGWRLKRHAEADFWRWLASWAAVVRHPRDLGFDEPGYDLPPLELSETIVPAEYTPAAGMLFPTIANTLAERIAARRDTARDRVAAAVELIETSWATIGYRDKLAACGSQNTPSADASDTDPILQSASGGKLRDGAPKKTRHTWPPITRQTKTAGTEDRPSSASEPMRQGAPDMPVIQNSESGRGLRPETETRSASATVASSPLSALPQSNLIASYRNKEAGAQSADNRILMNEENGSSSTIATPRERSEAFSVPPATKGSVILETIPSVSALPQLISMQPDSAAWIVWCNLNSEQDACARYLGDKCFSVYGSLPSDQKVDRISRWLQGERPVLLSKPSICGHGLNFQRCSRMVFVGLTDSFEQVYQAIRRCWRFGQTEPVHVHFVASELEGAVLSNIRRKERAFDAMLDAMSGHMRDLVRANVIGGRRAVSTYNPNIPMEIPAWLTAA